MARKEKKRSFFERLTYKYQLIIRNEEDFAEKTTFTITYGKVAMWLFVMFSISFVLSFFAGKYLLGSFYDPEHAYNIQQKEVSQLAAEVDSLKNVVAKKDEYIERIGYVMKGGQTVDEVMGEASDTIETESEQSPSNNEDNGLIDKVEFSKPYPSQSVQANVKYVNTSYHSSSALSGGLYLSPLSGYSVTAKYQPTIGHYGVDVVAKKNEPILAVADGTVIMSSWTEDSGNVIAVHHRNNVISIYKHNSVLLQEVGDFVKAGEILAIIGNSGELTNGPHLHFEMWQNGNPLNPEDFISF